MAADKGDSDYVEHVEHPEHEAALTGALALANLFSNCVEAFGLIQSSQKWEREEQLLLSQLGIQQARLLIWGDIVGVSSPPKSVTDRAVPKHPSSAYPDLKEPTFFQARDERLEDPQTRTTIEDALSAIVDRAAHLTREEMMNKYGLRPPKRFASGEQPAMDPNRLEAFREKYELLKEVAESYAHINTQRAKSIVHTSWVIENKARFREYIRLIQDKVDFLIDMMGVKERLDRSMRMDIKAFGWHVSADRSRVAADTSKLRLIQEICKNEYPEYVEATQQALDNISKDTRENTVKPDFYASAPAATTTPHEKAHPPQSSHAHHKQPAHHNDANANHSSKGKRPGLFGLFKSFRKSRDNIHKPLSPPITEPNRSLSDAGPTRNGGVGRAEEDDFEHLEPVRSKSVGDILDQPAMSGIHETLLRNRMEQLSTVPTATEKQAEQQVQQVPGIDHHVSRHDQYHGIGRVATKDLSQVGATYE